MSLTKTQKIQIESERKLNHARALRVRQEFDRGLDYADTLKKPSSYIAAMAVYSQIWENILWCLLELYKSRRRQIVALKESDRFSEIDLRKIKDSTLGNYISKLEEFEFSNKEDLIPRLRDFNRLRNEAVHHAFESKKETAEFEEQIKTYLDSNAMIQLREMLSAVFQEVSKELEDITKS